MTTWFTLVFGYPPGTSNSNVMSHRTSPVGIVHLLVYLGTDKDKRRSRAARQESKRSVERGVEVGRNPHMDQEHKHAER